MRILDLLNPTYQRAMYETRTAVHLIGPPGGGKSAVTFNEVPRILGDIYGVKFGVWREYATTLDAPDIRGFLVPSKDKEGSPISFFTRPGVMPPSDFLREYPRGLFIWDERSQGALLTQNAICPTVLDKEFGAYSLPEGWWMWSISNRMEDRAGVVRPPMQLVNRERTIELHFDITSTAVHWERIGMHPMGIAFAKAKPGVFANAVPKDPKPYCTVRSYTETWKLVGEVAGRDGNGHPNMKVPSTSILQELVSGDIGEGTAAELFAYLKVADQLPTIEQILRDPQGCKAPERLDAAYAAVQMCIHHAEAGNIDKLWTYVERLPIELQTSAAKSFVERSGGALLNSKALGAWIGKHKALIISSTR